MTRLIAWLISRFGLECDHRDKNGLTLMQPYFYGRLIGDEDVLVTLETCPRCGTVVAQAS